jgi:hypothetical protein
MVIPAFALADTTVGPLPRVVETVALQDAKKEPPKLKVEVKEKKVDVFTARVTLFNFAPIGVAYGYWPGPVLPGMWGGVYGGLWPDSWWLGGPYLYTGWQGSWGRGWGYQCGTACLNGGSWPTLLPPVFGPVGYPALSPYWVPRVAPYWIVPAAAWPYVVAMEDGVKKSNRAYRPVPESATAEKLYADALWLFWENNFKSSRDHLAAAIKQSPRDARMWYYKALSEKAIGDDAAARQSAENGAALEIMGMTDKHSILAALERVQGKDRKFLNDLVSGPKALSVRSASEIVANLKAGETTLISTK